MERENSDINSENSDCLLVLPEFNFWTVDWVPSYFPTVFRDFTHIP